MSLINDALKKAQQSPPRNQPGAPLPPLQATPEESSHTAVWLVPAIIIFLVFGAIFFIGWAAAHKSVSVVTEQVGVTEQAPVEGVLLPGDMPPPMPPLPPPPPEPVVQKPAPVVPTNTPPPLPKLQGIFYSDAAPSAILDGKTVRPGQLFKKIYTVKEITRFTVVLIGPDNKEITIGMGE